MGSVTTAAAILKGPMDMGSGPDVVVAVKTGNGLYWTGCMRVVAAIAVEFAEG